jgi:hypothetical protein
MASPIFGETLMTALYSLGQTSRQIPHFTHLV